MKQFTFEESLITYITSGFPLMGIQTIEVDRATSMIRETLNSINEQIADAEVPAQKAWMKEKGYKFFVWDAINGIYSIKADGKKNKQDSTNLKPIRGLDWIRDKGEPGVYVMQNVHLFFERGADFPVLIQGIREVYEDGKANNKHIVFVGSYDELPAEIRSLVLVLDFSLPNRSELFGFLKHYITSEEKGGLGLTKIKEKEIKQAADAAVGLTLNEVESAASVALVESEGRKLDIQAIFLEKSKSVRRSGLLEHISTDITIDDVGDLTNIKPWLSLVARAFTDREGALKYGLPSPKGFLLAGVSGTGKTLVAKAVAKLLGIPLFRFDVGRVYSQYVGETERKTREVFALAKAMAPCELLIDEVEKSVGGDSLDSGVSSRFIASLLYFLQETNEPVYTVATCNDVTKLPPELTRKGRFDELWFVDLPGVEGREEIFRIHIRRVGRDSKKFKNIKELALATNKCSGAEIEGIVHQAMFMAFADNKREFTGADMLLVAKSIVPLAVSRPKEIEALQRWASEGARPASITKQAKAQGALSQSFLKSLSASAAKPVKD